MAREEKAIFTVLCMVYDGTGNILVQYRNDPDWPGICFPGGHVEHGEAFTAAAIRETFEETGLTVEDLKLCGVKQFQTKDDARYVVFFYKTNRFCGTPMREKSFGSQKKILPLIRWLKILWIWSRLWSRTN